MPNNKEALPLSPDEIEELVVLLDLNVVLGLMEVLVAGDRLAKCRDLLVEERIQRGGAPIRPLDSSRRSKFWTHLELSLGIIRVLEENSRTTLKKNIPSDTPVAKLPSSSIPSGDELLETINNYLGWFYKNIFPIPAYFLRPIFGPHRDEHGKPRDAMFTLVAAGFTALCFAAFFLVWWFLPSSHMPRVFAVVPVALCFVAACSREITIRRRCIHASVGVLVGLCCWTLLPTTQGMNLLTAEYRAGFHRDAMTTASITELVAGEKERSQILHNFPHLAPELSKARRSWWDNYPKQLRISLRSKAHVQDAEAFIDTEIDAARSVIENDSGWFREAQLILFRARLEAYARSLRPLLTNDQFQEAAAKARDLAKGQLETAWKLCLDNELNEFVERYAYLGDLAELARKR